VSDIVLKRPLTIKVREDLLAWAGCVAGALLDEEYRAKLAAAGFTEVDVEETRVYDLAGITAARLFPSLSEAERVEANGSVVSAFIRARKPA
jgi:hypothetical protein